MASKFLGFLNTYQANNIATAEPIIETALQEMANTISNSDKVLRKESYIWQQLNMILTLTKAPDKNNEESLIRIGTYLSIILDLLSNNLSMDKSIFIVIKSCIIIYIKLSQNYNSVAIKELAINLGKQLTRSINESKK